MSRDSLLWELTHASCPYPVYLFGTIHLHFEGLTNIIDDLSILWTDREVGVIVTEMGEVAYGQQTMAQVEALDDSGGSSSASAKWLPPNGYDLRADLGDKRYVRIRDYVSRSGGLDLDQINHMHPLLALVHLTVPAHYRRASSMDELIQKRAVASGLQLLGLESMVEQMSFMTNMPTGLAYQILKCSLSNYDAIGRAAQHMLSRYKEQRIHDLYRLTRLQLGALRRPLIVQRNKTMLDRLHALVSMADTSIFVAVGAGHLSGGVGLLHLATKHGWRLRSMPQLITKALP